MHTLSVKFMKPSSLQDRRRITARSQWWDRAGKPLLAAWLQSALRSFKWRIFIYISLCTELGVVNLRMCTPVWPQYDLILHRREEQMEQTMKQTTEQTREQQSTHVRVRWSLTQMETSSSCILTALCNIQKGCQINAPEVVRGEALVQSCVCWIEIVDPEPRRKFLAKPSAQPQPFTVPVPDHVRRGDSLGCAFEGDCDALRLLHRIFGDFDKSGRSYRRNDSNKNNIN